jgi:hypothetical protein
MQFLSFNGIVDCDLTLVRTFIMMINSRYSLFCYSKISNDQSPIFNNESPIINPQHKISMTNFQYKIFVDGSST